MGCDESFVALPLLVGLLGIALIWRQLDDVACHDLPLPEHGIAVAFLGATWAVLLRTSDER